MSGFPSLPLFTDAYIADTTHLTNEEHGAYLRLIMFAWRAPLCRLPDDDLRLARMLGLTAKKWAALKPVVMAFWTLEDGYFSQKRLAREHAFVSEKVEKRRAAGLQGGRPKSLKNNNADEAKGSENEKQNQSKSKAPTPTPTLTPVIPKGNEPEGFAEFQSIYPARNVRFRASEARKRWLEARKRGAEPAEIIAGARAYAAEQRRIGKVGTEFVQSADVWLNKQRWRDYAEADLAPKPFTEPVAAIADDMWRDRVRIWRARSGYWPWRPSPPPDDPRTAVPRHVLAEFDLPPRSQAAA